MDKITKVTDCDGVFTDRDLHCLTREVQKRCAIYARENGIKTNIRRDDCAKLVSKFLSDLCDALAVGNVIKLR